MDSELKTLAKTDYQKITGTADFLLNAAKKHGAEQADCTISVSQNLEVSVRMGSLENTERSETYAAGLRIIIGGRQAFASTSSLSHHSLDELASRVVMMAKLATPDPYCGLADTKDLATDFIELDLMDFENPQLDFLESHALICEDAALKVENIENIAGCGASWGYDQFCYGATNGFLQGFGGTSWGLGIAPLAISGDDMERDYEHDRARFKHDLKSAASVGELAGNRAKNRLGSQKVQSFQGRVIFEARVAKSIIGLMISAISGSSIARGISFLKDRLGQQIFKKNINIIDDPFIKKAWGSRPFDGEGVKVEKREIIGNGVLNNWLLNNSSARQLGLKTNGFASFSQGSPQGIGVSNLLIMPSKSTRESIVEDTKNGILVTEAMSPSFNPNNGDYSVGVAGFLIENGKISRPVSEITIASNMIELFKDMDVANDIDAKSSIICPSLVFENVTIGGA